MHRAGHCSLFVIHHFRATAYQDSLYKLVEGPTWEEAESAAVALGGHLATINDAAENAWLSTTLDPLFEEPEEFSEWIGLNDIAEEGTWAWSSGETSSYRNWGSGEPDGQAVCKGNED